MTGDNTERGAAAAGLGETSTSDSTSGATSTASGAVPWLRWKVVGALAVVGAAAATAVSFSAGDDEQSPEAVVAQYLDVVRSGDVDAAWEYVSAAAELDDSVAMPGDDDADDPASEEMLSAAAMDGDWDVDIVVRESGDRRAFVDVTVVAADDTAREGRFVLEKSRFGDEWVIGNPVTEVSVSDLPTQFVEFNDVVVDAEAVWLFPGVYDAFPSFSEVVDLSASTYVAVPVHQEMWTQFNPSVSISADFEDSVAEQLEEWIDECALGDEPALFRCPFSGEGRESGEASVEGEHYRDAEVEWEPVVYPQIRLVNANEAFSVQTVAPGQVRISGEGETEDGEIESFSAICDIGVDSGSGSDDVEATLHADLELEFHSAKVKSTC